MKCEYENEGKVREGIVEEVVEIREELGERRVPREGRVWKVLI